MSIRQIARDLYECEKELARLQKDLGEAARDEVEDIQKRINAVRMERTKLKGMLEAKKRG